MTCIALGVCWLGAILEIAIGILDHVGASEESGIGWRLGA